MDDREYIVNDVTLSAEQRRHIKGWQESSTKTVSNIIEQVVKAEFEHYIHLASVSPKLRHEAQQLAQNCAIMAERAIEGVFEGQPPHTYRALIGKCLQSAQELEKSLFTPTISPIQEAIYRTVVDGYRAYCMQIAPLIVRGHEQIVPQHETPILH